MTQAIWRDLEPFDQQLSWLDEPGVTGFFRYFPVSFGLDHARRVEAAIDREIHKEYLKLKGASAKGQAARKRRRKSPAAAT